MTKRTNFFSLSWGGKGVSLQVSSRPQSKMQLGYMYKE